MAVTITLVLVGLIVALAHRHPVLAVGLALATVCFAYFIIKPSYERALHLMILTLPFLAAFVVNIGGNMRVPYFFAVIAFFVGLYQGKLRLPIGSWGIWLLAAFILYAFLSVALTFQFGAPAGVENFGFRTSQFRPLIQAGQLTLMVAFFYLTLNFLTSGDRLKMVSVLIFWSLVLVVAYGTYEVICALTNCSFFNINTNPDELANRFAGTQLTLSGDIHIPRPRSILLEPLNLGVYILFSLPFVVARLSYLKFASASWWATGIFIPATLILLALAWSRGAMVGALVALLVALIVVGSMRARLTMLVGTLGVYLVMGLLIFPILGSEPSLTSPADKLVDRLGSIAALPSAIRGEQASTVQIGRSYYEPVEIFMEHAVFGVGLGNYPIALARFLGSPLSASSPFSLHLELLTQFGIIGTSLFYLFVGFVLYRLFRAMWHFKRDPLRPLCVASFVSIVGVMTASMALSGLTTQSYLWVMLAIGLGIPYLMNNVPSAIGEGSP